MARNGDSEAKKRNYSPQGVLPAAGLKTRADTKTKTKTKIGSGIRIDSTKILLSRH